MTLCLFRPITKLLVIQSLQLTLPHWRVRGAEHWSCNLRQAMYIASLCSAASSATAHFQPHLRPDHDYFKADLSGAIGRNTIREECNKNRAPVLVNVEHSGLYYNLKALQLSCSHTFLPNRHCQFCCISRFDTAIIVACSCLPLDLLSRPREHKGTIVKLGLKNTWLWPC